MQNCLQKQDKSFACRFTSNIYEAVTQSEVIIVAVGAPGNKNGDSDLTYLFRALKAVAESMNGHKTIVIKSTVPVGTCDLAGRFIRDHLKNPQCTFDMASNPEFLREGSAVRDFMHPERIVIGADSEEPARVLKELYSTFEAPVVITDTRSAELIKYACNAYLATRISFINEMAEICEKTGADINSVISGMKWDKRIGGHYLAPGPGFGGPCLVKDIKSLINFASRADADVNLLKSVVNRNESQIKNIFNRISALFNSSINKNISVLGLSFKAGTRDTRNSPAISLLEVLGETKNKIKVYDPAVRNLDFGAPHNVRVADSLEDALEESDCIILMTEWEEFRQINLDDAFSRMRTPVIIDTRNLLKANKVREAGFQYIGIGIGTGENESPAEGLKLII